MAEFYRHHCGYIREIRRSGASRKGKFRKRGHVKTMACVCGNMYARFIKI